MKRRFSAQELFELRNTVPVDALIENVLNIPVKLSDGVFRFLCPVCSENGMTTTWIPEQKLENYLSEVSPIEFSSSDVKEFVKYGFRRIKATVSNTGTISFGNRKYYVAEGAENFSKHKSTKVYISCFADKLFIFEYKDNGLLLGEALCQKPFEKPVYPEHKIESNEVELIAKFLEQQGMVIERVSLT